jgi:hypothetical protein
VNRIASILIRLLQSQISSTHWWISNVNIYKIHINSKIAVSSAYHRNPHSNLYSPTEQISIQLFLHESPFLHNPDQEANWQRTHLAIRKQTDKYQATASCSCNQRGALTREMRWLALVVSEKCWYKNTLRRNKCHGSRISHPIRFSMKSRWQTSEIDRLW